MKAGFSVKKLVSLALKIVVVIFAVLGTLISMGAGTDSFMGGTTVLMYFTIQSNIALAVICGVGAVLLLLNKKISNLLYIIKYVGTMAITVTGLVFCFILAPTLGGDAWTNANIYTHVIVPLASVIDFFIVCTDANIKKRSVIYTTIPPLAYAVYAGIGYVNNWMFSFGKNYPYFFLNWGGEEGAFGFSNEFPYMGCVWWILALLVGIIIIALVYLGILNLIKRALKK